MYSRTRVSMFQLARMENTIRRAVSTMNSIEMPSTPIL